MHICNVHADRTGRLYGPTTGLRSIVYERVCAMILLMAAVLNFNTNDIN